MQNRLFHPTTNKNLIKALSSNVLTQKPINPSYFRCLQGEDVITAKVSDHHPMIHNGVLFWNIMMQGKLRNGRTGISYNNGLGIIETDKQYIHRMKKIADVIAEMIYRYPAIDVISLCEGPIQSLHINTLLFTLKKYPFMNKFFINAIETDPFHKPNIAGFPNWGLLMLADKKYSVSAAACPFINDRDIFNKLANRFQLWQLTNTNGESKYVALGHFPFGGDECVTEKSKLSIYGNKYCQFVLDMMNHYSDKPFILCADFNLNPYLINRWEDRVMDMIANNNSILFTTHENVNTTNTVTVDGILLSSLEKQKYYSKSNFSLFSTLRRNSFIQSCTIIQNRHNDPASQQAYDQQFGLTLQ